ncbi:hypothetical protein BJ138DRAFT_1106731 [Hygrophoropsis aurantiaca]|uniref:Uncharacterized protein n=1 Tax=Hygrophoropsis aurantiaca TaxID=72124 RepID=A0ACB7ZTZ9_9AGAM|nr:hypothetical protein BJ138DRAFT_1106731 [Hygrophoropsis aurantiaca]
MSSHFYQLPDLLAECPLKSGPPNVQAKAPKIQSHENCGRRCLISWNLIACKNAQAAIGVSYVCRKGDAKTFEAAVAYAKAVVILEELTQVILRAHSVIVAVVDGQPILTMSPEARSSGRRPTAGLYPSVTGGPTSAIVAVGFESADH